MDYGRSKRILDLYINANENKHKIVNNVEGRRSFSEAEITVLSCLYLIAEEAEKSKMSYLEKKNYDETIKILLIKSLKGKLGNLTNKEKYEKIIDDYDNIENYTYNARVAYKSFTDNIYAFLNPVYPEEQFINQTMDLQDMERKGHLYWGVKSNRIESILEHIYGCCVLALGVEMEYGYSIDMNKLLKMLLIHETGEILIGDLTEWDIPKDRKRKIERDAVSQVCSELSGGNEIVDLFDEFEKDSTLVSEYANLIDKLEYDLQVKLYEMNGQYDYENIPSNEVTNSDRVRSIMENSNGVFDVHYEYDKNKYSKIPCMRKILEQAKKI